MALFIFSHHVASWTKNFLDLVRLSAVLPLVRSAANARIEPKLTDLTLSLSEHFEIGVFVKDGPKRTSDYS